MYESNDDDHTVLVDQRKIASVFGTMVDFDRLRYVTTEMKMYIIMDFIPNHTGRLSEWFIRSQKKEGKYSDYCIWAACDPRAGIYPNNLMNVKGQRAWTYDDTRKECFYHQLEDDKPELNLWNPEVKKELENILHFWLKKGVDGFHIPNVQYLFEDLNLGDKSLISGKMEKTRNHRENAKILKTWKVVLDSYNSGSGGEKILIITADDDLNATMRYIDAGVTIVRDMPLSDNGASLAERIETKLKDADFKKIGWMLSNKYSSRVASIGSPQQTKALLTLQATLPGVMFNYYGNEIGMADNQTLPVPLKYRTPMQWNSKGTGFSQSRPWLDRNRNYMTINVESEKAIGNDYAPLKVYKQLQKLREKESFRSGEMRVFRDGDLLMYTRKAEGNPGYLVVINLGNKSVTHSFYLATGIPPEVKVVFHSHKKDNSVFNLSLNSYILDPNEAVVLEYQ